jgi:hypothetical protein
MNDDEPQPMRQRSRLPDTPKRAPKDSMAVSAANAGMPPSCARDHACFASRAEQQLDAPKRNAMTYSSTFKVGHYVCRMIFAPSTCRFEYEWNPHEPPRKSLTKKEIAQYRAGRDALLAEVASDFDSVLVIEV